jgi:uncharacterized protein YabN with tetrapyrrole methylase and pyrophosphatase domain
MTEPLADALRLQRAAAAEGFDWTEPEPLWVKLAEEIDELRAAETTADRQEELGDLLFMVVNLARHLGVDSVAALTAANTKFSRRYAHVMAAPEALPPQGDPARIDEMERRWQQAKQLEREGRLR